MNISVDHSLMQWMSAVLHGGAIPAFTIGELKEKLARKPEEYIVHGFLPANDVNVAVGDSGRGKTPLAYQLGICVAAGIPFLEMPTKQSRVLYLDLENGRSKRPPLAEDICSVVGLDAVPDDFLIVEDRCEIEDVADTVEEYRPGLLVADTLRALAPEAEESNPKMGRFLKESRSIAQKNGCSLVYLHHVNKPREVEVVTGTLGDNQVMDWLYKASGARALVNQTNARIGIDKADDNVVKNAALLMKWFVKLDGESENVYIERVLDDNGNPIGYRRITGVGLLGNMEQQTAFAQLPARFTFKQAMRIYDKTDKPTREWLLKCIGAGILRQPERRGLYERMDIHAGGRIMI